MPVEPNNITLTRTDGQTLARSAEPTVISTLKAQVIVSPPGRFKFDSFTDVERVDVVVDDDDSDPEVRLDWLSDLDPNFVMLRADENPTAPLERKNEPSLRRTRFILGKPAVGAVFQYKLQENLPGYRLKVVVTRQ